MFETTAGNLRLDVCKVCQFVWFDAQEFEQMPVATPVVAQRAELPRAAREAIALAEVQWLAESVSEDSPPETWQYVPAVFGLPVECDSPSLAGYPAVTWTVAFLVLVASIAAFMIGHSVVENFALVPAKAWRYGGLTFITSFFLHGGVLHLASNLYFFLIFGDNVEDYLGRWRFGALLFAATLAGGLAHVLGDPRTAIPCVGASGGISGITTFYALQFPKARLGLYMRAFYRFQWVQFPAWAGLAFWVVLQFVGAAQQLSGFSNVSALAHLGGATTGLLAWLIWRARQRGS
jgi:membrane associated rhomboid family serine protease